ncbi:hypothetical protein H9P43_007097 [Blastocladiella emersonii ATCC 22665]|nr:hypothetical protein H9P43_007097 [Blastocladiella emersonii ATCC 22665]
MNTSAEFANPLAGLPRLADPTYGLPPPLAARTTSLCTSYSSVARDLARQVATMSHLVRRATHTLPNLGLVGAGHVATSILAALPPEFSVRQCARLPPANPDPNRQKIGCDVAYTFRWSSVAVLACAPAAALGPVLQMYAGALAECRLVIVVAAGAVPEVVRRMVAGTGIGAHLALRVVCVAPGTGDVAVVRATLDALLAYARDPREEDAGVWPGLAATRLAGELLRDVLGMEDVGEVKAWDVWRAALESDAFAEKVAQLMAHVDRFTPASAGSNTTL